MPLFRSLAFILFLFLPAAAHAQVEDSQLWLAANASLGVADHTRLTLESIGRFSDNAGGFFHAEVGGIATFMASPAVELGLGYRHVEDWDHGRAKPNEERLRQQVTVTLAPGFTGRLRLEQRFQSTSAAVGIRVRPQLRYALPLDRGGLALFVSHEDFVNFNDTRWGQRAGHERMRNAIGLSIPLSTTLRAETGYLNQYRFGRGRARDAMDHAGTLNLTLTL